MKNTFRIFRIAGIDIGIHYSWIFIFIFFSWSLAQGYFPSLYPSWTTLTYWVTGVIASLMIFVSVLLHELAHSLVAKARKLPVSSITLFILGGVSNLEEEPEKPGVEFTMAIVGPLTSLVLAAIFWGIASGIGGTLVTYSDIMSGDVLTTPVASVVGYLSIINLFLGIFNLLPGFPLDGGRVLRSIIWSSTNNLVRATNIAAGVGLVIGWIFIALGIFMVFTGNIISGIWLAFIGWFLTSSASSSRREITLNQRLGGIKIRQVMDNSIETVSPNIMVSSLVADIFSRKYGRAIPVCSNDTIVGIVTISDIKNLPQERWDMTPVSEVMTREPLYTVSPDDNLNDVMKLIAKHDVNQVIVKQGGRCDGMLSRGDIMRYLQFRQELGTDRFDQ